MIYLVPESEVEKTCEIFCEKNALADFHTEKYLNRVVTSPNQLVEKIQIFDAGKDDRRSPSCHENSSSQDFH